jgi:Xaa-Pro aminopeptidase
VVTGDGVYLAANNIEAPRLLAEELPLGFAEPVVLPWPEDGRMDRELERRFGRLTNDTEFDSWFRQTRVDLLPCEADRYTELGVDSAAALEEGVAAVKPGASEFEAAGTVSELLWAKGIEPITLLVASDDRSELVRHFVPTDKLIHKGFIFSICARRGGLVTSATRIAAFQKGFAERYGSLLQVERVAFELTVPGAILGDVFRAIMEEYGRNGLPGEWERHHQGGMTGYLAREVRVDADCRTVVKAGQVYAWNPSAAGAKCEDTVLVGGDGTLVLTPPNAWWPTINIGGLRRPEVLRH